MVAIIKTSGSLQNALQYNENKLKEKKAELIHAEGFLKDIEKLRFTDKINRFKKLTALNDNVKVNSIHISLNFDPSEKISKQKLQQIADAYMQKIGFADQPYLVYQHNDSGHPHIHIVTTNIRKDGSRISTHNIGRNQSEKARKEIEVDFILVKAESKQQKEQHTVKPVVAEKVHYGHSETKRAMTNVLNAVIDKYKYSSLAELNVILVQYNMLADQGRADSIMFKNGGLVYRVLNERGEKVGVPIKASDFYNKPTLKSLEKRFEKNELLKRKHKQRVRNAIDDAFYKHPGMPFKELGEVLKKEKIQFVLRRNEKGEVYGITYVDNHSKCVFKGSDLGKAYSANQIKIRTSQQKLDEQQKTQSQETKRDDSIILPKEQKQPNEKQTPDKLLNLDIGIKDIPSVPSRNCVHLPLDFLKPQEQGSLNAELNKEQKKKRKKKLRH